VRQADHLPDFGLGTACGWGRPASKRVEDLLPLEQSVAEAVFP